MIKSWRAIKVGMNIPTIREQLWNISLGKMDFIGFRILEDEVGVKEGNFFWLSGERKGDGYFELSYK